MIKENNDIDIIMSLWILFALFISMTNFILKNINYTFAVKGRGNEIIVATSEIILITISTLVFLVISIVIIILGFKIYNIFISAFNLKEKVNKFKTLFVIIFIFCSFGIPILDNIRIETYIWYGVHFKYWVLGYIASFVVAYFMHLIVYKIILKKNSLKYDLRSTLQNNQIKRNGFFYESFYKLNPDPEGLTQVEKKVEFLMNFLFRILTPDYSYAMNYKVLLMNKNLNISYLKYAESETDLIGGKIRSRKAFEKANRKFFIEYSNWLNLVLSCFYIFLTWLVVTIDIGKEFMFCFITFKILSRTLEIIIAFYKDVVRTKKSSSNKIYKSSSLLRGNRISLAVHSYLEVVILFSGTYYLINNILAFGNGVLNGKYYLDFLLHSFSISSFTAITTPNLTMLSLFYTLQVFTSITLVVLSIATYIGLKDEELE